MISTTVYAAREGYEAYTFGFYHVWELGAFWLGSSGRDSPSIAKHCTTWSLGFTLRDMMSLPLGR